MKITIIGAGGNIGQRITKEAASRNHELKLITSKSKDFFGLENVKTQEVDIFNTENLANAVEGSDVVISAYNPPQGNEMLLSEASKSLISAAKQAKVRLIAIGGAASLKVDDDTILLDTPEFPDVVKPIASAHKIVLDEIYRNENELEWTNVSPSAKIFEGDRTDVFRVGGNHLLTDEKGESSISMEDFAVGILNEVENKDYIKQRFTIGY